MIPFCSKECLLFSHFQSHNEQNPVTSHVFDTLDIIETDLCTSTDTSEREDNVFDNDSFFKDNGDIPTTFFRDLNKVVS